MPTSSKPHFRRREKKRENGGVTTSSPGRWKWK